jgi:hypothetical protein
MNNNLQNIVMLVFILKKAKAEMIAQLIVNMVNRLLSIVF